MRTAGHALLARVAHETEDGSDGTSTPVYSYILFLKPSVTGDEPQDVLNYQSSKKDFPNESTLDQYFDEGQWESYRRLGVHVAREVFEDLRKQSPSAEGWQPLDIFMGRRPGATNS